MGARAIEELLAEGDVKASCAAVYEHPAVRWLLGGELHPGGEATTRRTLELLGVGPEDRLLDVASGTGASVMLAARELGCEVVGVDYGEVAVRSSNDATVAAGLSERVSFVQGDAEALPHSDGAFDAVLCECSLCTFPDKAAAVAEICRVLRPGGRVAISDVIADAERLPDALRGAMATVACVGEALPRGGHERLFTDAGIELLAIESRDEDALALVERTCDRLRGARLVGFEGLAGRFGGLDEAIELARMAAGAIGEGALGYAIFVGER